MTSQTTTIPSEFIKDLEKETLPKKEKKTLTDLGFLVRSQEAEKRRLLNCIKDLNANNKVFVAVVTLNMDCNLGCRYCFEGTRKGKHYMSAETADAFLNFLTTNALKNMRELKLVFFGGEPLLSQDMLVRIAKGARSLAKKKKMKFSFSLITNGTLLTPALVKKLKSLGLTSANVTIDGPKEVHDTCRPFKSGTGSFNTIIRNVKNVSNQTDIVLGGNYTRKNYRTFPRLLDHLIEFGLTPDKVASCTFAPVAQENKEFSPDFNEGSMSANEPWMLKASVLLREEILKRGFATDKLQPLACFMEREHNLIVHYDGSLYKCPTLIGRKEFCVGSVTTGVADYCSTHCLDNWKNEKCLDCAYLPLCFGGCRYMKVLRTGKMRGVDCKKEFFDKTLEAFVRQDVQYKP